ncbi:hypothetical protein [Thalassotalea hakodatensis]|uniref:hypothetical protein n=1 Tax=Thalassotalea hakodatensis TaxID=3030492 RepID=UPI0025733730|nr:hypothetical protein [Thalassotalea hakodatensis]
MKQIFYCEWLRYKKLTIVCAVIYVALLFVLHAKSPLYTMSELAFILLIIVPSLFAITLGVNQFLLYKKSSHWTYLIHKPLPMFKIYAGLTSVFLAILLMVILVPLTVYIFLIDINQPILVEPRHFLLIPYITLTALSFYFAGVFVTLHPKKLAYVIVLIPFYVLAAEVKGVEQFAPLIFVTLLLFLLSWSTFKEDLQKNLHKPISSLCSNVVTQYSLFILISLATFEIGHIGTSLRTVDLSPQDDVNYYSNAVIMDDKQRMLWNINGIEQDQYANFQNELSLSTFSYFSPINGEALPKMIENQPIMDDRGASFFDKTHKISWRYSHQFMLFSGFDRNGDFVGWLGKRGRAESLELAEKFDYVPFFSQGYLYLPNALMQYNESEQVFDVKLPITENQRVEYTPFVGSNFVAVLLTNEIQMFMKNQFFSDGVVLKPTATIPLNTPIDTVKNITFAELFDGHLISINIGTTKYNTYDRGSADIKDGYSVTYKAAYEANVIQIASRPFKQGWSDWMFYRDFVISYVYGHAKFYFVKGLNVNVPQAQLLASIVMMILVALITTLLMLRSTKSMTEKVCWVIGSTLAGIPGLITCWFFSDWRPDKPIDNNSVITTQ